jgi:hypothetical protein
LVLNLKFKNLKIFLLMAKNLIQIFKAWANGPD